MNKKTIIGIVCILFAIALIITPFISNDITETQNGKEKDAMLSEIEDLMKEDMENTFPSQNNSKEPSTGETTGTTENGGSDIETDYPTTNLPIVPDDELENPTEETTKPQEPEPYKPYRTSTNEEVDGILSIPAIDLELPILTNVTKKGLNKTCARVTNTDPPGSKNYCLMGHTMKKYGYVFNRLNELKNGDTIIVKARNYTYTYQVTEVFVTQGLDMQILENIKGRQVITMFCCEYSMENARLVVRGDIVKITPNTPNKN